MPCLPRIWHPETEALFAALQRSTLRRKVNREEHGAVPAEIRRWVGGRRA